MSAEPSYWDSAAGRWALAQGKLPMPEYARRFFAEVPERIAAAREFRRAHDGASSYDPLTEQQERELVRQADAELRRADSRIGGPVLSRDELETIVNRERLLAMGEEATRNALVTRGPVSPADMAAWRNRARGIA
jgi:hypothetical protein